jgi:hypothetical protein
MINYDKSWIPLDPTRGRIFKNVETGLPASFPVNFVINPDAETDFPVDIPITRSMKPYVTAIQKIEGYEELGTAFTFADPFYDSEAEAGMLRFLYVSERLALIEPVPMLAFPYKHIAMPEFDPETEIIDEWRGVSVEYIYLSTHKGNAYRRLYSEKKYGYLNALRPARLALLAGDYDTAEERFVAVAADPTLAPLAREDVDYYRAVIAYETKDFENARKRFEDFLAEHEGSRWNDRVYYQLACIAHAQGAAGELPALLENAGHNSNYSLFLWRAKMDMF